MTNLEKLNSMTVHELAKIMVRNYDDSDWDIYYISTPDGKRFDYYCEDGYLEQIKRRKQAFDKAVKHTEKWLLSECDNDDFLHHNDYLEITEI